MAKKVQCRFCQSIISEKDVEASLEIDNSTEAHICKTCTRLIIKGMVARKKRLKNA